MKESECKLETSHSYIFSYAELIMRTYQQNHLLGLDAELIYSHTNDSLDISNCPMIDEYQDPFNIN